MDAELRRRATRSEQAQYDAEQRGDHLRDDEDPEDEVDDEPTDPVAGLVEYVAGLERELAAARERITTQSEIINVWSPLLERFEGLERERDEARGWLLKSWWAPAAGSEISVYRSIAREDDAPLAAYLLSIGAARYVPKGDK
jgi:hypothetical protein